MKGAVLMATFSKKTIETAIAKFQKEKAIAEEKIKPLQETVKQCDKKTAEYQKLLQQLEKLEADFTAFSV